MCLLSSIYTNIKYICSLFPPCIEYDTDLSVTDLSTNIVSTDIPVDIPVDIPIIPIIPVDIPIIPIIPVDIPIIPIIPTDLSANIVNPIISKERAEPQSLSKILRYKYHLSAEKSNTLSDEYRTLKAILSLSEEELAECKTSSGRRYGKNIAKHTYDLLHSNNS